MYGEFREAPTSTPTGGTSGGGSTASRRSVKRQIDASTAPMDSMPHLRNGEFFFDDLDPDYATILDTMSGGNRTRRQANRQNNNSNSNKSVERVTSLTVHQMSFWFHFHLKTDRLDACESTVEVVTPYWAANSSGKIRAIVNTQHFEQAVHQEVCSWVFITLFIKFEWHLNF